LPEQPLEFQSGGEVPTTVGSVALHYAHRTTLILLNDPSNKDVVNMAKDVAVAQTPPWSHSV